MPGRPTWAAALFAASLALSSCVRPSRPPDLDRPQLTPLSADACRQLLVDDGSPASLRRAATLGLDSLDPLPAEGTLRAVDRTVRIADLRTVLETVRDTASDVENWPQELCARLQVLRVDLPADNAEAPVLVTGYYEPELHARRQKDARFRYPLYRPPADLVDVDLGRLCEACPRGTTEARLHERRVVPFYTRAEIDAGALDGKGYELAWLDDPIEAFFLHVQGSGTLRFDDGTHMQVSFTRANGHPYRSIGSLLVERGELSADSVSLSSIKHYLRTHPEESAAVMAANPRYVFFRAVPVGPVGSTGVPLTAGRSVAADAAVYPRAAVAFVGIGAGNGNTHETARLVVVQDSGAAIRGPRRLDFFWGSGAEAEARADGMRARAQFYLLLPLPADE